VLTQIVYSAKRSRRLPPKGMERSRRNFAGGFENATDSVTALESQGSSPMVSNDAGVDGEMGTHALLLFSPKDRYGCGVCGGGLLRAIAAHAAGLRSIGRDDACHVCAAEDDVMRPKWTGQANDPR
jgi:hypothetical protein